MRIHTLLLVAACLFLQCDSLDDDNMRLTQVEAEGLVYGFMDVVLNSDIEGSEIHSESESRSDITYMCPEGGNVRIVATVSESESDSSYTAETSGTFIPQSCGSGGFVLTGNPSIVFSIELDATLTSEGVDIDMGGDFDGTMNWDYGDRSGICRWALDLDLVVMPDLDLEVYLRGQACDNDLDVNISDIFEIDL